LSSSVPTEVFTDEKKELIEFKIVNITRSVGWGFAIILNGVLFYWTLHLFIAEEMYLKENNYTWVFSFIFGQIMGLFVYSLIILFFLAFTTICCRKKKGCLVRALRQSSTIYDDYEFTLQFKSKPLD
jgi:MFS family permease